MRRDVGWMSAGTLAIGLSGYVFLSLVGHVLVGSGRWGPADAAALSSVYLLSNIVGPGLFVAIEQETSRLIGTAAARRQDPAAVVRRTRAAAAVLGGATLLVLLAAAGPLGRVFGGRGWLIVALGVNAVGSAAVFWVRGLAGGRRRFRRYAATLLIDAAVRIVGCLTLAVAGVDEPAAYGVALCAGPLVAALLCLRNTTPVPDATPADARPADATPADARPADATPADARPADARPADAHQATIGMPAVPATTAAPPPPWRGLAASVGALVAGSGLAMTMANLAPVLVAAALPGDPALAFAFAGALVLTRVPLLLMGPVQALLLPRLTAAVALDRPANFRAQLRRGLLLVAAVTVLAVAGAWWLGPWAVGVVFGRGADLLPGSALAVLALAAGLLMAVALAQPGLVALGRHGGLLAGWVVGAALFAAVFLLPLEPVDRALLAQVAGPAGTLLVHLARLRAGRAVPPAVRPDGGPR